MRLGSDQRTNGLSHMHAGTDPDRESLNLGPGMINIFFMLIVVELKCPVEGQGRIMFLGNFWDAKGPLDYPIELLASPTGREPSPDPNSAGFFAFFRSAG